MDNQKKYSSSIAFCTALEHRLNQMAIQIYKNLWKENN